MHYSFCTVLATVSLVERTVTGTVSFAGFGMDLLTDLFAVEGVTVPTWGVLLIVVGFPAADVLMSLYSSAYRRLFAEGDATAFTAAWSQAAILRWINVAVALGILLYSTVPLSVVGFTLPGLWLTVASIFGIVALVVGYAIAVLGSDPISSDVLSEGELFATPKTQRERFVWLFSGGITAGITEEAVYRGIAIAVLVGAGLPVWAAILVASLSFVFSHGLLTVFQPLLFPVYLGIGIAFSLFYLAVGSLLPVMVVHGSFNLVQTINNYADGFEDEIGESEMSPE